MIPATLAPTFAYHVLTAFYLDGTDYTKCSGKNQIIQGGLCLECSSVIASCFTCQSGSNKPTCSSCADRFYLFDPDSDDFNNLCNKCEDTSIKVIKKEKIGQGDFYIKYYNKSQIFYFIDSNH